MRRAIFKLETGRERSFEDQVEADGRFERLPITLPRPRFPHTFGCRWLPGWSGMMKTSG